MVAKPKKPALKKPALKKPALPKRAPQKRAPLSPEKVLLTAMRMADKKGIEALSMRNLAQALKVEAMSLYNHVPGKERLLDGLVELVVGELELPVVGGDWQGACFPFRMNFQCGIVRVAFLPDGSLAVGETNRGWGSRGTKPWGLERCVWTGVMPFEIHSMHATPNGFRLRFTKPVAMSSVKWADTFFFCVKILFSSCQPTNGAISSSTSTSSRT